MLEEEFVYKGYNCEIFMTLELNARCGYVCLPPQSKYYNVNYSDIPISCHGGLTFSDFVPDKKGGANYWIGFDCSHCYDTPEIWTQEAVRNEIERLVEQL